MSVEKINKNNVLKLYTWIEFTNPIILAFQLIHLYHQL